MNKISNIRKQTISLHHRVILSYIVRQFFGLHSSKWCITVCSFMTWQRANTCNPTVLSHFSLLMSQPQYIPARWATWPNILHPNSSPAVSRQVKTQKADWPVKRWGYIWFSNGIQNMLLGWFPTLCSRIKPIWRQKLLYSHQRMLDSELLLDSRPVMPLGHPLSIHVQIGKDSQMHWRESGGPAYWGVDELVTDGWKWIQALKVLF